MKALVLAAAIAASELDTTTSPRRRGDKQPCAERNRFTDEDLADMFGDMEPEKEAPPPPSLPEPDWIGWEPGEPPREPQDGSQDKPIAA